MRRSKKDVYMLDSFDVPKGYYDYSSEEKEALCNKIVDTLLMSIDRDLDPTINRITFLDDVLKNTLRENEKYEMYEVCQVISDCIKQLSIE